MPAYLLADVKVSNPEQYLGYQALTPAAIAAGGGEFVVRGGEAEVIEGGLDSQSGGRDPLPGHGRSPQVLR